MKLACLLVFIIATLALSAHAETLRDQVRSKILIQSTFYDTENVDPIDTFEDAFNSSSTNITTPTQAWQELPSWLRYTCGTVIVLVGAVIAFYGVRLLPLSVFLLGGFTAAIVMYVILATSIPNSNSQKTAIVYGTSAAVWIVAGIILACCINFAVFILGVAAGAVTALVLDPIVLKYVWPAEPMANMIIWVVVFGIIGGLVACCLQRPLLIAATAAGGAFAVVASIMAMDGTLSIAETTLNGTVAATSWQDWAGFAGFLALTTLACIVQLFCTATSDGFGYAKLD